MTDLQNLLNFKMPNTKITQNIMQCKKYCKTKGNRNTATSPHGL